MFVVAKISAQVSVNENGSGEAEQPSFCLKPCPSFPSFLCSPPRAATFAKRAPVLCPGQGWLPSRKAQPLAGPEEG